MGTAYLPSPAHMIAYRFFTIVLPTSDYMFFLDVQPEEADRRIRQTRNRREMFENMSELKKIRTKAISLALMDEWHIIDAGKPVADVEEDIANVVQPLFQNLEL
jgi:dTMP kinase